MVKLCSSLYNEQTIFTLDFLTQLKFLKNNKVAAFSWLQGDEKHLGVENIVFGAL